MRGDHQIQGWGRESLAFSWSKARRSTGSRRPPARAQRVSPAAFLCHQSQQLAACCRPVVAASSRARCRPQSCTHVPALPFASCRSEGGGSSGGQAPGSRRVNSAGRRAARSRLRVGHFRQWLQGTAPQIAVPQHVSWNSSCRWKQPARRRPRRGHCRRLFRAAGATQHSRCSREPWRLLPPAPTPHQS